ncbi:winged helix-turn-helix domain-containing protein [Salinisphaera sp.]|uniref:winged helix-turn-helix domain-containing protein n=1 Tax=Salinisphaera sp. TaxID=1914330 RepID=UPI003C79B860
MQFVDWRFSADFGSAIHARTAEAIRFTHAERALLEVFAAHGDRVYRRDALLDAVSGYGSDVSDRSIDFIINRLRRKLRDSARHPRYIQTRYGEGYAWIAERVVQ